MLRVIRDAESDDLPAMRDDYILMHPEGVDMRVVAEFDARMTAR